MTTKFTMHLIVPATLIGPIIELVDNEGITVSVEPYKPNADGKAAKHSRHYVGGRHNKDISGRSLLLQSLLDGPKTRKEIERIFVSHSFATTSSSPTTSIARTNDLVAYDGDFVKLTPKGLDAAKRLEKKLP